MSRRVQYDFLREIGAILNAGQSRSVLLTGEIHDLYYSPTAESGERGDYVPLLDFLLGTWRHVRGKILVVYEINGPIRFVHDEDRQTLLDAWLTWRTGMDRNDLAIKRAIMTARERAALDEQAASLQTHLQRAAESPNVALELLRQLCVCSRAVRDGKAVLGADLIVLIEGADLLLPEAPIHQLSDADRHRIAVCHDWFSDPDFARGGDAVVLMAESASMLNRRIVRLPQVLEVTAPGPDESTRLHAIELFMRRRRQENGGEPVSLWGDATDLARLTAGLSIHALFQLLLMASHQGEALEPRHVIAKVQAHIRRQLGDDVVEFKKPVHRLDDVVGFDRLKAFLRQDLIPRLRCRGKGALSGAAVCGPIGVGKTFIFEALAAELDLVVLVLKNIRSKWFGETDVVFERLRRAVMALDKVLVFVDEADTQFGGVGADTHDTERRLTGKIQAMMSDSALRGRVVWLLMTARIHLLSPDIRRPGRVGDLIIPVLDPVGDERDAFCRFMVAPAVGRQLTGAELQSLRQATAGFSAAGFASLRAELAAKAEQGEMPMQDVLDVVADQLPADLGKVRRYQTLQALLNCTRRSLLPDPSVTEAQRAQWGAELQALEAEGVR